MNSLKVIFDFDTWQEIFGSISKQNPNRDYRDRRIMGIFIYITLSGAAKGLDNGFEREFQDMAELYVCMAQRTSVPYAGFKKINPRFTISNVKELNSRSLKYNSSLQETLGGIWGSQPASVVHEEISRTYNIYGDFPEYTKLLLKIYKGGRFINEEDQRNNRKVCVIGERTQEELFKKMKPLGKIHPYQQCIFQVIGDTIC